MRDFLRCMLGSSTCPAPLPRKRADSLPAQVVLKCDPPVQAMLEPVIMRLVCLIVESRLAGFLAHIGRVLRLATNGRER
jgi:hypothetical protein